MRESMGTETERQSTHAQPRRVLYNLFNARGDVVTQSNDSRVLTWTASSEAIGRQAKETGSNTNKQRANNEGQSPQRDC